MATLPVKCNKCETTVNVDIEKYGLKCPSCGIWINTVRELQAQHPKWTGLLEQEKKLNEEYTRLNEYESFYESDSSKAKRFFMKYKYAILMFIIDVAYIIFRLALYGFTPPGSALEVMLIVILLIVSFSVYLLPAIRSRVNERNEEINGINFAREERPKVDAKMRDLVKEKEEYLEKFGQKDASQ
jgi:NADH:ubiquinone oxidoreductase subunit 3 (subunit A)